jgi:hypothetical protein
MHGTLNVKKARVGLYMYIKAKQIRRSMIFDSHFYLESHVYTESDRVCELIIIYFSGTCV